MMTSLHGIAWLALCVCVCVCVCVGGGGGGGGGGGEFPYSQKYIFSDLVNRKKTTQTKIIK